MFCLFFLIHVLLVVLYNDYNNEAMCVLNTSTRYKANVSKHCQSLRVSSWCWRCRSQELQLGPSPPCQWRSTRSETSLRTQMMRNIWMGYFGRCVCVLITVQSVDQAGVSGRSRYQASVCKHVSKGCIRIRVWFSDAHRLPSHCWRFTERAVGSHDQLGGV